MYKNYSYQVPSMFLKMYCKNGNSMIGHRTKDASQLQSISENDEINVYRNQFYFQLLLNCFNGRAIRSVRVRAAVFSVGAWR